jgi:hypothetical protein
LEDPNVMSKHKVKRPAPETTTQDLVAPPEATTAATTATTTKPESIVDEVFDVVTGWAAEGLVVAKRGLEASARWLDARAKVMGELADKLSSTSRAGAAAPGGSPAPSDAQRA